MGEQLKGGFGKVFQETAPAGVNRTIEEAHVSAAEQIEKAEAEGLNGVQQGEGEGPPETSLPFSMLQVKTVAGTEKKVDAALDIAPVATNATSDLEQQKGGFGKVFQETAPAEFNRTIGEANVSAAEQIEKAEAEGLNGVQQGEGEGPPE